jgi:hypothetical protein
MFLLAAVLGFVLGIDLSRTVLIMRYLFGGEWTEPFT